MTRAPAPTVQRAAPWRVALPALAGCVLAVGSVRGSIGYMVIPAARRSDVLPPATTAGPSGAHEWWRVTTAA